MNQVHVQALTEYWTEFTLAAMNRELNRVHIFTVNGELSKDHISRESCHACLLVKTYMYMYIVHVHAHAQ